MRTYKIDSRITCNPFRHLNLRALESLVLQQAEMEDSTKILILDAIAEKKSASTEEQNESLIGHSHLVKHVS